MSRRCASPGEPIPHRSDDMRPETEDGLPGDRDGICAGADSEAVGHSAGKATEDKATARRSDLVSQSLSAVAVR